MCVYTYIHTHTHTYMYITHRHRVVTERREGVQVEMGKGEQMVTGGGFALDDGHRIQCADNVC